MLVQINLLQQRSAELARIELMLVFPEEFAPVDDPPVPKMEQIYRDQRRFRVVSEDIGVFALGRRPSFVSPPLPEPL